MKIKITVESTADLSPELAERYGIHVFPLGVRLGEDTYLDGVDMTPEKIYASVAQNGILPQTNSVSPADFEEKFAEFRKEYDAVIHFSISSKLSSCYQNALIAAEEVDGVHVVDSLSLSTGIGLLAIHAAVRAKEPDADAAAIAEECRRMAPKLNVSFVLGNLDYMHKGGRCSGIAVFGANLLKLRPELEMRNGELSVVGKYRGPLASVLRQYVANRLKDKKVRRDRAFFTDSFVKGDPNDLSEFGLQTMKDSGAFDEVLTTTAGATITSHCGNDCFGILFLEE